MASAKASSDVVVEPGKVNEVRNQLLLQGDEGLAHRLQNEEFDNKYQKNRAERQVARQDVPLAKVVYTEEEERLQRERYERLQMEKTRAEEDARIAAQLEREEKLRRDLDRLQEDDVRLAQQMQQEELKQLKMAEEDEKIAMKLQKQELVHRRSERRQRELEDQSIAQRLQERERRLAALINAERELRLQQPRSQPRSPNAAAGPRPTQDTWLDDGGNSRRQNSVVTSGAIVFDDAEDESDREERLIQQDREMAKALQDLELDQSRATRRAADEQLYDIVGSDARLARIMQEQERLEVLRRAEERRLRRAAREYNERMQRQAAMHTCGAAVQPPEYDPPAVPRYVDPHAQSCCVHHHCDPHQHAVRAVSHDPYCGHVDPNMHQHRHHQHPQQAALPADFLRLDDGFGDGQQMRRELGPQQDPSGRSRDVNGPGPVYIGPAGPASRSQSVRDQRNDYYAHETSDPMAQRRSNSKGSGNKSGNCKQQ